MVDFSLVKQEASKRIIEVDQEYVTKKAARQDELIRIGQEIDIMMDRRRNRKQRKELGLP